ncbi:4-hydroxy-tetrahydrodipicolinate synthase [Actinoplanes sp. TBRC 11911]|uniref:dihydrodipicolinate synthase family protein n=1 Tax=Actinoplanes sp. TBRC 11911 TaxID=2729386 RepID=UPI00145F9933|nr:dihydrodipicolinate synthase family protein [Actinoplanes sp. TBRC 11911]NMO52734.1 4-hydroxy-tetrahydrodipicolinate synthase [Actinoplanes sp. TBRC 11911]
MNGLYVPLITPFDADGSVAWGALERLAHTVLDEGAAGLVALGTTGEPSALTPAEREKVVSLLAGVCVSRGVPLIAGDFAGMPGVSAALTLVPPFVRPGEDGVVAHLSAVAAASPVPLVVYHVPYRTGQALSAAAIRRIAAIPGVAGMKLAAGGIDAATIDLMSAPPPGFAVLGGDDVFIAPLLALGAQGAILASAHIQTSAYASLIAHWHSGELKAARDAGDRLARLSMALFAEPNPTVVKAVLHAQGRIPSAAVRLPLLPASAESVRAALAAL